MIHIDQNQKVAENENLIVSTATGDYADNALIEFVDLTKPNIIAGSFEAQYIKYGGLVYRFNNHQDLGAEILKIDPTSTHTAASYVRMTKELLAQMEQGSLEPTSLDQAISTEQSATQDQMNDSESDNPILPMDTVSTPDIISTTTPAFIESTDTSTTTPEVIIPESTGTSTTTPQITIPTTATSTDPIISPTSSSTPPTSTTTDEIVAYAKKKIVKKIFKI
jgi:hypothetical protein